MGEIERLVADADDGTVDADFLKHLYRGGELLAAGNVEDARDELEQAYQLQPKNQKAQNLLGLTYFKLGVFDRASEIYEALVRDNPVDPTLRVNLGLVYLKLNALQRATREFETAVDLAPDHKKAQNYLGLAYAQAGDYARAKDCFVAAGSVTMAEKMERALKDPAKAPRMPEPEAARPAEPPPPPPESVEAPPPPAPIEVPPPPEREVEIEVEVEHQAPPQAIEPVPAAGEVPVSAWEAAGQGAEAEIAEVAVEVVPEAAVPPLDSAADLRIEAEPEVEPEAPVSAASLAYGGTAASASPGAYPRPGTDSYGALSQGAAGVLSGIPTLTKLTRSILAGPSGTAPFEIHPEQIVVRVQGEMLTRLEGLVAVSGTAQYVPEMKRFRGKATDKAFGDIERRMVRVSGAATLLLHPRGRTFVALEMNDESAYFLEESVFAFEESVVFENGRVPSKIAPDLHLVHLRGKGKVLLGVPSACRAIAVTPGVACVVPMPVLVGWHGTLTPRIVGLPEEREGSAAIPAVELSGDGYALLSPPKPPPQ